MPLADSTLRGLAAKRSERSCRTHCLQTPLELTGGRQRLLERAPFALGRLDSTTTLLPDPQLSLYAYLRREAVLSSQIEGTESSLSDLLLFQLDEAPGVPFDDVVEVANYVAALSSGGRRAGWAASGPATPTSFRLRLRSSIS